MFNLSESQVRQFQVVLERLSASERDFIEAVSSRAAHAAIASVPHGYYPRPSDVVLRTTGERVSHAVLRGLIATWALSLPARVAAERLPESVTDLYPFWLDQLAGWLVDQDGPYDPDSWAKDVRFTLCLSVPGNRTQTLDLISVCGAGQIVRDALKRFNVELLSRYLMMGGRRRPWLQTHTDARHTHDFNEVGWTRLWANAAAICQARPELAGVIGSSWFFDPPLETISPHLTYLRVNPTDGGAFMVDQGPGQTHTDRASETSLTRRALIQSGEYKPHSWLLAWPRTSLIAWADHGHQTLPAKYDQLARQAA